MDTTGRPGDPGRDEFFLGIRILRSARTITCAAVVLVSERRSLVAFPEGADPIHLMASGSPSMPSVRGGGRRARHRGHGETATKGGQSSAA